MTSANDLEKLFDDKDLYNLALTHRSWVNENPGSDETNERLEFLGDAVLEFVVSDELYKIFSKKKEGFLTALRANLVNTKNLSDFARKINLGSKIKLSKGEEDGGGRDNSSLLADTVEAIIGALFLDKGIKTASSFIKENILFDVEKRGEMPLKDPKSRLQEVVQAKKFQAPKYRVLKETGPDHDKKFEIEVLIDDKVEAVGAGKNKSEAEQKAAETALEKWENLT